MNLTAGESVLDEAPTTKHKIRKRIVLGSRAELTQKKGGMVFDELLKPILSLTGVEAGYEKLIRHSESTQEHLNRAM